jgi:Xaa-Pro aminopeptidase
MSFTNTFYKQNRTALKNIAADSLLLIAGNSLMQRSADTSFPFRQDSNILYLSGVEEPNVCLLINPNTNEEFIMIDANQGVAKIFDGIHDEAALKRISGIKNIITITDGLEYIAAHSTNQPILFNEVTTWNKVDFTLNDFRQRIKRRLQARRVETAPIQQILAPLRSIKQPEEIHAITKAVHVTFSALANAEQAIYSAKNEQELLHIIDTYFSRASVCHAYTPIIAAGNNANTLHHVANNAPIKNGDAVLFDVGAEYEQYAADISRTYIKGKNTRAQAVIDEVQQVQSAVIRYIAPGITWRDITNFSLDATSIALKKLGIVHASNEVRSYMPHAIGHFLGLDVHDSGDYTAPIAENMVFTVEPGIYLPSEGIGVRIEDDVIVTKTGAKILN